MKRINNTWEKLISIENGIEAVRNGTIKKRGDRNVRKLLYDENAIFFHKDLYHMIDPEKAENFVKPIIEELKNGIYIHQQPRYRRQFCKTSSGGKWRDLYIPSLKDHTVHHMAIQANIEVFIRGMYPHCCGSVPGRGIKHILKYVKKWIQEDPDSKYFVKLDIVKFFDNIDKDILFSKIQNKLKDKRSLALFETILNSAPVCCPIGYYPSPWLSNLYLEDFDWFVAQNLYKERRGKRINYVKHFLRYADDILLIGSSRSDLYKAVRAIIEYLKTELKLTIKPAWEIKAVGEHELINGKKKLKDGTYWCDIGGYKFSKDSVILRDEIYLSTKRLAKQMYKKGYYTDHKCREFEAKMAWARKCDSRGFIEQDILPYVNQKIVRRTISELDKNREFRVSNA